jgi:hypothetical protein
MAAMKALAFALLVAGGTIAAIPALATDNVMPQPVTDYMPPVTDEAPPPASDEAPPPAAAETRSSAAMPDTELPPYEKTASPPVCDNCPPPRRYDSQEIIKKIREIDRSRTINTTEMAPDYAPRREPGAGYRMRSDVTLVNFVVHRYRVIFAPELVPASEVEHRALYPHRPHRAACKYGRRDRNGSCRPLRVHG